MKSTYMSEMFRLFLKVKIDFEIKFMHLLTVRSVTSKDLLLVVLCP